MIGGFLLMDEENSFKEQLNESMDLIPEQLQSVAKEYIEELNFMRTMMNSLKNKIAEQGAVELWINGKQKNERQTPAFKSYMELTNRYNQYLKQFIALFPSNETSATNELQEFLKVGVN